MRAGFVITFLLVLLSTQAMAKEIILAADPWPPFNMAIGGEQEGYIVDIARLIFEAAGYKVIYKNVPWQRAIEGTRSGNYTGVIGASKRDAKGFVFPAEELSRNYLSFYVRKDSRWKFEGPASIESIKIGVAAGYDYRHWLNKYIRHHSEDESRVQVVASGDPLEENLKKLIAGRIDAIVGSEAAICFKAREMGILDKIKPAGYGVEPAYIYIAFSPNLPTSPILARQLSIGIRNLRRSGRLKDILDKYGLHDWK